MSTTTATTTTRRRRSRARRATPQTPQTSQTPPPPTNPFADTPPVDLTTWMPQPSSERPPQMAPSPYPPNPNLPNGVGPTPYGPQPPSPPQQFMSQPPSYPQPQMMPYPPSVYSAGYSPASVEMHMLSRTMDEIRLNMQQMGTDVNSVKVGMEGIRGSIMPRAEISAELDKRVNKDVFVEFKTQTESELNSLRSAPQRLIAYIAICISAISVIGQLAYYLLHH